VLSHSTPPLPHSPTVRLSSPVSTPSPRHLHKCPPSPHTGLYPGSARVNANVTTAHGVMFVPLPPDLTKEPHREEFHDEKKAIDMGQKALDRIVGGKMSMTKEASIEWKCLQKLHSHAKCAAHLPSLPTRVEVTGDATTAPYLPPGEKASRSYKGTPCLLRPILREMQRFPRPYITWQIFDVDPPTSFPTTPSGEQPFADCAPCSGQTVPTPLRDPRVANNVTHKENTDGQRKRGLQVAYTA
jgi:hypothetical protein